MKHRGARREQMERAKRHARALWGQWKLGEFSWVNGRMISQGHTEPTERWVGHMASTHCKPCSGHHGCGNRRRYEKKALTVQEMRTTQDALDTLVEDESMGQIRREVDALQCDKEDCDCRLDEE